MTVVVSSMIITAHNFLYSTRAYHLRIDLARIPLLGNVACNFKKIPTITQDLSRRSIAMSGESVSTYPRRPKAVPIWNLVVPCSFPRYVFFHCCFVLNWYDLNRVSILIWQDNAVTIGHRYMFVWCFYYVLVLGNRRLGSLILSTLLMNWFTEMSFIY